MPILPPNPGDKAAGRAEGLRALVSPFVMTIYNADEDGKKERGGDCEALALEVATSAVATAATNTLLE